ncbi:Competence protein CoiA-like family protein [Spirosomataceae bacterium TFI 002]|nr:Competence protein CoiA-like family protein [Spirosomataceae bacterium TFI 002]
MKKRELFIGLRDGLAVSIHDVENGLKCKCICPKCGNLLVAHQGKNIAWHFKHHNSEDCEGALESSIHLAAKQLLLGKKIFYLGKLYKKVEGIGFLKILDPKRKGFKSKEVILEQEVANFKPDVIVKCDVEIAGITYERILFVEIYVTHEVDEVKRKKIIDYGTSAIQIDLSNTDRIASIKDIWKEMKLQRNLEWIYNSRSDKLTAKAILKEKTELENRKRQNEIMQKEKIDSDSITYEYQSKKFENSGLSKFKIYGYFYRKHTSNDGVVYCPKLQDKLNPKLSITECESCDYHEGIFPQSVSFEYSRFSLCSLNRESRLGSIEFVKSKNKR